MSNEKFFETQIMAHDNQIQTTIFVTKNRKPNVVQHNFVLYPFLNQINFI